jgi:hypothetical protein
MVDRVINYAGAIPLDVDLLNTNKNLMIGLGFALQAILGGSTVVDGLACTATGPASLQVLVAQGSIYSTENVDGTAFGSLGSDTTHQIVKQGIVLGTTTIPTSGNFGVPATTGYSINYLIQCQYEDVDGGSTVLPYYNSSNPAVAYNGPNNTGTSQNTVRQGNLVMNVKAGTAATTGTQVTPTPDAGFTPLWVITVANGATTITSGNIALYPGAPFINYKLPQLSPSGAARSLLTATTNFYVSPSGSDSTGNGSSVSPWATPQNALNSIARYIDIGAQTCNVNLAAGTYPPIAAAIPFVGGVPNLIGNTGSPSSVIIAVSGSSSVDAVAVYDGVVLNVSGIQVETTTTGNGFAAYNGGIIFITGASQIGACAGSGLLARTAGSFVAQIASLTYSGVCGVSANRGEQGGHVYSVSQTSTLTGSPTFAGGFASVVSGGMVEAEGMTYSGSVGIATSPYWNVSSGGIIDTGGVAPGSNYFPGNSAGIGTNFGTSPYGLIT